MYSTEQDMVKQFLNFNFNGSMLRFFEFGVGYGVADIVYCVIDNEILQERIQNGLYSIVENKNSIRVVDYLCQYKASTLNAMMEDLYLTKANLKYILLKRLIENGFVIEVEREYYTLKYKYQPFVKQIIAIEAKLKDWRAGYFQARRYLRFAHQSYVAIGDEYKHRVQKETLMRDNIGLLSISDTGVNTVFEAKVSNPKDKYMFLLANEKIFSLILKSNYHLHDKADRNFACVG